MFQNFFAMEILKYYLEWISLNIFREVPKYQVIICNECLKKGCYATVRKMVKIGKMSQDIAAANGILI